MRGQGDKLYYPQDFIPVAEAMGLIHQIDLWVVNHAFELLRHIPSDTALAVNLSGNIFLDPEFISSGGTQTAGNRCRSFASCI